MLQAVPWSRYSLSSPGRLSGGARRTGRPCPFSCSCHWWCPSLCRAPPDTRPAPASAARPRRSAPSHAARRPRPSCVRPRLPSSRFQRSGSRVPSRASRSARGRRGLSSPVRRRSAPARPCASPRPSPRRALIGVALVLGLLQHVGLPRVFARLRERRAGARELRVGHVRERRRRLNRPARHRFVLRDGRAADCATARQRAGSRRAWPRARSSHRGAAPACRGIAAIRHTEPAAETTSAAR